MRQFVLYTANGPLYRCVDCGAFVSSKEHVCEQNNFVYTEAEIEEIKRRELEA